MKATLIFLILSLVSCSCNMQKQQSISQVLAQSVSQLLAPTDDYEDEGNLRILHLDGSITKGSSILLIAGINKANKDSKKNILIEINSPGGTVDDGLLISKAIEKSKAPVNCVVDGEAHSMAYYVLQSCKNRMMTKRSVLMIHGPAIYMNNGFSGQYREWQNYAALLKALERSMVEHMAKRMKVTPDQLEYKLRGGLEWHLSWKEAEEIGAVDLVVDDVDEAKTY